MLRRSSAVIALCALAGCQDYNFNPVGKCIIQPGSSRIQLANVSTADILFVVDDSGSMSAEQASLARNFSAFIGSLATAQAERIQNGLDPFEFHLAVTTSSVFEAWQPTAQPACTGSPLQCNVSSLQTHYNTEARPVSCSDAGGACNEVIQSYWFQTTNPSNQFTYCANPGVGVGGEPYPAGNFVAAAGNARVLHFTKDIQWTTWGTAAQDPTLTALVQQFQQNIAVGTCGSGMEQHFEAGRLAVKKALQQDNLKQVGVDPKEWPHAGAKMVVVWVGDEDDCSNPNDGTRSLAFTNATSAPGADVCTTDAAKPLDQQRELKLSEYADYFTSLGRPFSAAFIYSAVPSSCAAPDANGNVVCDAGTCICQCPPTCASCGPNAAGICNIPTDCTGKATGTNALSRFHQLSGKLRDKGVTTFEASVCDYDFSKTLKGIAELVKPPAGLTLPTRPATSQVAVLRIESSDGKTSRFCTGPGAGLDWDFVDCKSGTSSGGGSTACISINHGTRHCEANAGETYIAQYLGQVPEGGCATALDCRAALGGVVADWQCYGATGSAGAARGTCVCSSQ